MSEKQKPAERGRKNQRRPLEPTGKLLKELRKASGYSQEEIRAVLGFKAASAVSRLESGDFSPDIQRLKKLLSLLKPNPQQTAEILAYFGYTAAELEADLQPARVVRHHPEQHALLSRLQALFYLFVYQKDYANMLEQLEQYQAAPLELPQVLQPVPECRLIVNELYSCRRLLAQGMLDSRQSDIEEGGRRADAALDLIALANQRLEGSPLPAPGPALLAQLHLHALLCAHSCVFKRLNIATRQQDRLAADRQFARLKDELVPKIRAVLAQLQSNLPAEELHEVYRMHLFIQREYLHLQTFELDSRDAALLTDLLAEAGLASEQAQVLSLHQLLGTNRDAFASLCCEIYRRIFAPSTEATKVWKATTEVYHGILREHQRLPNWDGEASEVMRAILNTLMALGTALGRSHQYDAARLYLDVLYLRLNVSQTHFNWHSTYALIEGYRYLALREPKPNQTVLAPTSPEALQALASMTAHLQRSLSYLERSPGQLERGLVPADPPEKIEADLRLLRYTFLEEPVFYLILLHTFLDEVSEWPAGLPELVSRLVNLLETSTKGET